MGKSWMNFLAWRLGASFVERGGEESKKEPRGGSFEVLFVGSYSLLIHWAQTLPGYSFTASLKSALA